MSWIVDDQNWALSQSEREWGANALQSLAAVCFMQMDGRRGDGRRAVLYSLPQRWAQGAPLPVRAQRAGTWKASHLPPLASKSSSSF
jgi:hypothetical protein